jgi:hypothetical protein
MGALSEAPEPCRTGDGLPCAVAFSVNGWAPFIGDDIALYVDMIRALR